MPALNGKPENHATGGRSRERASISIKKAISPPATLLVASVLRFPEVGWLGGLLDNKLNALKLNGEEIRTSNSSWDGA